jgi:hypothetical protein
MDGAASRPGSGRFGQLDKRVVYFLLLMGLVLCLIPVLGARAAGDPTTVTLIEKSAVWKYNDSNTDLGSAWRAEAYDDSAWKTGKSPLGYPAGDNNPTFGAISAGTLVASQSNPNAYITYYFRKSFEVADASAISKLDLTVGLDDGYVLYINGTEVRRTYMPADDVTWQTFATYVNEPSTTQGTDAANITAAALPLLKDGANTIAVEMHNRDNTSSDIFFGLQLTATSSQSEAESYSIEAGVKTPVDDSEEFLTNSDAAKVGLVDDGSSDLEICKEKPGSANENNQIIGVRFADLGIPRGATITSAYIQFTGDQDNDAVNKSINPFSVNIQAEDTADSAQIQKINFDISSRTKTAASVTWSLDGDASKWAVLESGVNERTPDLTALVQHIVDKADWSMGHAMTFLLTGNSGCRAAVSSEDGSHGPVLHVTFSYDGVLRPAPTGLAGVAPTSEGGSDGQITGVSAEMEYKPSAASTWTACTGATVTGLAAGTYDVRYAASNGQSASTAAAVKVPEHQVVKVNNVVVGVGASETQRTFTWFSNSANANKLQASYKALWSGGAFPSQPGTYVEATAVQGAASVSGMYSYRVTVPGIESGQHYIYRVGNDDAWSDVYELSTQTFGDGEFSFLFAGDPQIGSSGNVTSDTAGWTTTLGKTAAWFPNADFLVSLGDQVESSTNETQYSGYLSPGVLRSLTLANNIGNHDTGGANFQHHFTCPNMSSTLGVTNAGGDYWWSYESVLFMALNSNDMSTAEHRTFMEDAIAAYKAGSGGKDPLWKIVTFHHSVYSTASHTTDGDIIQRRNELPPLFKELGVDAVLSGHDHVYTRSLMMDGTTPVTTGYTADGANTYASYVDDPTLNETVYLTANSASGSKYYAIQNLDFPFKAVDNQESTPNISKVDVATDSLTFTTYRTGAGNGIGDVVDTFTLEREPDVAEAEIQDLTIGVGADETERLVTWYGNSGKPGELQLALASAKTGDEFPAAHESFSAVKAATADTGFSSFKTTVSGLQSGQDYVYRVGNDDVWSDVYEFSTQTFGDGEFSFLFAGDPQIGSSGNVAGDSTGWATTLDKAATWFPGADFLVSLGDQVDHATNETEYTGYLAPDVLRSLTLANNIGNHDDDGINFKQHFSVPNAVTAAGDSVAGGDYWWSYEGVLFMALNTNNMSTAQHKAFLEGAIAAYKAQHGGADPVWKIVTFHHSVYSTASHSTSTDILQRRNELPPVFEELGIDAVLSGHDHVYTRSLMMDGTTPVTTGYTADGANTYARYTDDPALSETVYLTANSASGSKYYAIKSIDFPFRAVDNQESTPNLGKVDVKADSLTFTTYRTGAGNGIGDVVDTFKLVRLQTQDAPAGLVGVAPTGMANDDGKITGVAAGQEYKASGDDAYTPVAGSEIAGLAPGTYLVRYAAKEGFRASEPTEVTVAAFDGLDVTIGAEQQSGKAYRRVITARQSGKLALAGKFFVVKFTEKGGSNSRTWSMAVPAEVRETTVWYYAKGTRVEVWLTDGIPAEPGVEETGIEVFAYAKSDIAVESISLDQTSLKLLEGQKQALTASVLPADAADKSVTWASDNTAVARVDADGLVTGVAAGKAVITATTKDGGKTATCTVTVTPVIHVKCISLNKAWVIIRAGQKGTLSAAVSPSNATNKDVSWSSSNSRIVSVDQNGRYTGLRTGTAVITVKSADGGKTDICMVTVVRR